MPPVILTTTSGQYTRPDNANPVMQRDSSGYIYIVWGDKTAQEIWISRSNNPDDMSDANGWPRTKLRGAGGLMGAPSAAIGDYGPHIHIKKNSSTERIVVWWREGNNTCMAFTVPGSWLTTWTQNDYATPGPYIYVGAERASVCLEWNTNNGSRIAFTVAASPGQVKYDRYDIGSGWSGTTTLSNMGGVEQGVPVIESAMPSEVDVAYFHDNKVEAWQAFGSMVVWNSMDPFSVNDSAPELSVFCASDGGTFLSFSTNTSPGIFGNIYWGNWIPHSTDTSGIGVPRRCYYAGTTQVMIGDFNGGSQPFTRVGAALILSPPPTLLYTGGVSRIKTLFALPFTSGAKTFWGIIEDTTSEQIVLGEYPSGGPTGRGWAPPQVGSMCGASF
jgi:hypothetical protein